ncbi:MAG: leucine-rich repeat domain-containing protein [Bacteroidales bacterium]|nr:leucine-rich repeat domain-containing protein [Bacteroidales bacterium]
MKTIVSILFFFYTISLLTQNDFNYKLLKPYKKLSEIRQNPDSVQFIKLTHKGLKSFPSEIFLCKNLIYLDLSFNRIEEIPPQIAELKNLRVLNLGNNRIKTLPPEIGKCSQLSTLILRFNDLSTLPSEIGNLTNLKSLNLAGTNITSLPEEIQKISSSLQYLDLRVIPLTKEQQSYIENLLPHTRIFFSQSCNCRN